MTERLLRLGCFTAFSLFLSGLWPLALAQDSSSAREDTDDPVDLRHEQLETELKGFFDARDESLEELTLRLIKEGEPTVEEIRLALDRVHRSGQGAYLQPGISHDHTFEVAGLQLSASLYVPATLKRPGALWVIPSHPSQKVNSDEHFEYMFAGLPEDALVLWVHLQDAVASNPDTPVGRKYRRGKSYVRQRIIDHRDVFAAAVAMALRRFPVDPNRVYCWGVSASGIATWWNGVCLPDVFAGICCCDTRPIQVIPWMDSLLQMRVGILHGEKDDRCPVELLRRVDKVLQRFGVQRKYLEIADARHGVTWRRHGRGLCSWIAEHDRDPRPLKVTFYPDQIGDRSFWLETLALDIAAPGKRPTWGHPPAKVIAEVRDDGTIDITTHGVTRLRVWLDKNAASIQVNNLHVNEKPAMRLHEALAHVKARRDPQLFWAWAVDVQVAANDN